jgi:hypothetical protein
MVLPGTEGDRLERKESAPKEMKGEVLSLRRGLSSLFNEGVQIF